MNLLGEHTDYNGGPVLPIALERRLAVMAGPAPDWQAVSSLDGSVHQLDVAGPLRGAWTDYLVGVVRELHAVGAAPRGAPRVGCRNGAGGRRALILRRPDRGGDARA